MLQTTINDALTTGCGETLLAGRYRVVKPLGQGGMGSVYLAEDTQLDNFKVAIKMLPAILVANKRAIRQLKSEALVSLKLSHPNIATMRAFEENDCNPFIVMDYVEGQTLDDLLADKGTLTEEEMRTILAPVAAALDYAHTRGVVHRDVKPGNVMIAKDGTPFVLDFGIAREIHETMTRVTGKLSSGTLMYMSPEQLTGELPAPAQDIYSFAAMVYECLKGEPPFVRGAIEDQIKNKSPAPLPGGARSCVSAVMAGLAKRPEERPVTCAAVLGGAVSGTGSLSVSERNAPKPNDVNSIKPDGQMAREDENRRLREESECIARGVKTILLPGGIEMRLRWCPAGTFLMGSPDSEKERASNELQHRVTLTKGFWLGEAQVTQKQWRGVTGDNPSYFNGDDNPVECISWEDAQKFCERVDTALGCGARLPTEAEWEYACRAGTTTAYSWGDVLNGDRANCDGKIPYGTAQNGPYLGRTSPVDLFGANAWGFNGMHGNVWEWCEDWFGDYPSGDVTDPEGPAVGSNRVLRGGGWNSHACDCRSAFRSGYNPGCRSNFFGFRLACSTMLRG